MMPAKRRSVVGLGIRLSAVLVLPVVLAAPSASQASPAESRSAVTDPTALKALARSAAYLRSLPGFKLHATVTDDEVVHGDFKLQRSAEVQVLVRRPDRMRADLSGDFGERLFVYDGKTFGIYLKNENYYGSILARPTLRETLAVVERYAVELPLVDIIFLAMGGKLDANIQDGGTIGTSKVAGVECLQLAFRGDGVDWQLWITVGAKPVPRKLVITTTDDPTRPQYTAVMDWDVSAPVRSVDFSFQPPADARRMTFTAPESRPATTAQTPDNAL